MPLLTIIFKVTELLCLVGNKSDSSGDIWIVFCRRR